MRWFALFAFLTLAVRCADDVRIGPKPHAVTSYELQTFAKRLEKWPIEAGPQPQTGEGAKLLDETRAQPEFVAKLLVTPQMPGHLYTARPEIRVRAAWLLGFAEDRRAMQGLLDAAVYDDDENVRFAAAKALSWLQEPVAFRRLIDIAISKDLNRCPWPMRKNAAAALRRYGEKEIVERLLREVSFELAAGNPLDPKNRLRGPSAGLGTDNALGLPDSTPKTGLPDHDLYPALAALKQVTGQRFDAGEKEVKTWREWWRDNEAGFVFKD